MNAKMTGPNHPLSRVFHDGDPYPATPDLTIAVGDRVRSFDFPGSTDCYVEGTVVAIDARMAVYKVRVERRVFEGMEITDPRTDIVLPPMNGRQGLFGMTRGVVRVA